MKTKLQIMREKAVKRVIESLETPTDDHICLLGKVLEMNEEFHRSNINMHDALDLKSERIQELKKQLATAAEALKDLVSAQEQLWTSINGRDLVDKSMDNAKQALAEIGGEDE